MTAFLKWPVESLSGYQITIYQEYSNLQDYLWKSPGFIPREIEVERIKIDAYFPDDGDEEQYRLRSIRRALEEAKLFNWFPSYMAQSNLFLAASYLEKHLLRLSRFVEDGHGPPISNVKGNGIQRYLAYIRANVLDPSGLLDHEQVLAALTVRNALLHASGDLTLSRDAERIRQIVSGRLYMNIGRRKGPLGMMDDQGWPEICISDDILKINQYFSQRVTNYFFRFLLDLSTHIAPATGAEAIIGH